MLLTSQSWVYCEWGLFYHQIIGLLMTHTIQQGSECYRLNKDTKDVNNQINDVFKSFK